MQYSRIFCTAHYTVPKAFSRLKIFQSTPQKFPRYEMCCIWGVGGTYISRYGRRFLRDMGGAVLGGGGQTFRDIGGAVLGVEGGHTFEIWEVLLVLRCGVRMGKCYVVVA